MNSSPTQPKSRVAVVGASGYAGEELLERLVAHPGVELACLTSRQHAGCSLEAVYPRLHRPAGVGSAPPHFVEPRVEAIVDSGARWAFLALPHGLAAEFAGPLLEAGLRVVDLSADFRLRDPAVFADYYGQPHPAPAYLDEAVYGLPELGPERRAAVAAARLVAAPGCYPTSLLVPLVPLLRAGVVDPERVYVTSLSGVTGAGRKVEAAYLFGEVNETVRPYGVPRHRHLAEIEQELALAAGRPVTISFTPHLLPISRGILSTCYLHPASSAGPAGGRPDPGAVDAAWRHAYRGEPFVRLLNAPPTSPPPGAAGPGTREAAAETGAGRLPEPAFVARTNFVDLAWRHDPRTGRWIVFSALDNLTKGAAGQAVQCFNLMAGWPESAGLGLAD